MIKIPDVLSGSVRINLDCDNWLKSSNVFVTADLSYDGTCLLVLFDVKEPQIRAEEQRMNGPVHQDSCVEVFLQSPQTEPGYRNFEFSASGAVKAGKGRNFHFPEFLIEENIEVRTTLAAHSWRLYASIDLAAFDLAETSLKGLEMKGNFYKCGELLDNPHYLSLSPLNSLKPDFHQPQFFELIQFV